MAVLQTQLTTAVDAGRDTQKKLDEARAALEKSEAEVAALRLRVEAAAVTPPPAPAVMTAPTGLAAPPTPSSSSLSVPPSSGELELLKKHNKELTQASARRAAPKEE